MTNPSSFADSERQQGLAEVNQLSLSPLFLKLLAKRNFTDLQKIQKYIHADLRDLEDPFRMKGMKEAVRLIKETAAAGRPILIHGDYDVDGVTATALMAKTFLIMGISFSTFLPDRVADGYGVSIKAIRELAQKGRGLLITADCGITAIEKIAEAKKLGLDVIVIDHHRIPEEGIPPADVILNPRQNDCPYFFKELSAAGLVFKLSQALIGDRALQLLDLAALSTVCDVAPLEEENRIIVKKGLEILANRATPGLSALISSAGIKSRELNSGHIGFMLGPRINAAGRMSSPEISLRLLVTSSEKEAGSLAQILEEENKLRQKEERDVAKEAVAQVERTFNFNRDHVIVAAQESWHQGVIGIVASRLVDRFHRPAIVIALDKGKGKGSGRSIKGFHLYNAMEHAKEFLLEFGGHEQAAGLSIAEENVNAFRQKVNEYAAALSAETFVHSVKYDLEIKFENLRSEFFRELKLMEPHGAGNPRPVFLTCGLTFRSKPEKNYQNYKFLVTDGQIVCEVSCPERIFQSMGYEEKTPLDLTYSLKTKVWDGIESLVLEVKDSSRKS